MSIPLFALLIPLGIFLALMVLGVKLLRRGWWPGRMGEEPHCRGCEYSLRGIASERCPECGLVLSEENIAIGRRERRPGIAGAGAGILLLELVVVGTVVWQVTSDVDWYRWKPTFLVMRDLRAGSTQAMSELNRREADGSLSSKYEQQIDEMALAQQATTSTAWVTAQMIGFLEKQYVAGHLSEAQKKKFGQQCATLALRVRPVVVQGDSVPYRVDEGARIVDPGFVLRVTSHGHGTLDGKAFSEGGSGSNMSTGLGSGGSSGSSIRCEQIGKHQLCVSPHVELLQGNFNTNTVVYQEDRKLTADFEVQAKSPANAFKLIDDPSLGPQLRAAIVPVKFTLNAQGWLECDLNITSLPVNVAFDVFARTGGHEHKITTLTCNKGTTMQYGLGGSEQKLAGTTQPATIDLIFRSNEKIGRESIDQTECWKGELVYRDVAVTSTGK